MIRDSNECKCEVRQAGKPFKGWSDYYGFLQKVETDANFEKIPVEHFLYNVGFEENWYKCTQCSKIWRLIEPDPPFAGQWQPVEEESCNKE